MKPESKILLVTIIILIILLFANIGYLFYEKHKLDDIESEYRSTINQYEINLELEKLKYEVKLDSYKIYQGIKKNHTNGVNGVYWFGKDYYCVNVRNRTISAINKTDYHEYCHYLIDNDENNHFCK